jgi:predicted nucleic acid-binding protein
VSAQTLAEFYSITRKAHVQLSAEATDDWIEFLSDMPLQVVDQRIVMRGIELSRAYRISYYDAALIAAAERLGAPIFYSEDLNHSQRYGSVTVLNPFLEH